MSRLGGTSVSENTDFQDFLNPTVLRSKTFDTVSQAAAQEDIDIGDLAFILERSAGVGNLRTWKAVDESTVTTNGDYIVASTGNVGVALVLVPKGDTIREATQASAIANKDLQPGEVIRTEEFSAGNRGGAVWDVVLASGVTIDALFVVACTGVTSLALVYREGQAIYADEVGILPGSGQTTEIGKFLALIHDKKLKGVIRKGQYDVNAAILSKSSAGTFILYCEEGEALFNYTGSEIGNLIQATDVDIVDVVGINVIGNDLVAAAFDTRVVSTGTSASYRRSKASLLKQTTLTVNPVGIQVIGAFDTTYIEKCEVNFVSYTSAARTSTGVGISGVTGLVTVKDSIMANISTPDDEDADGLKVFSADFGVSTTPTRGKAVITGNEFRNCEGRGVKLQITDFKMSNNKIILEDSFTTITEWRGIDAQAGGGDMHHNTYRFGTGITWGANAKLVQITSVRNDGIDKVSYFAHNACETRTAGMSLMAGVLAEFGDNTFRIEDNTINGATIKRGVQFRAQNGASALVFANLKFNRNTFEDLTLQDLFFPFDNEDFGDKLFLEFVDNEVTNNASAARFYQSPASFSVGNNFKISNSRNITDRVDWALDMDGLPGGNDVFFGTQTITNLGTGIGTFGYISTKGLQQQMYSNSGSVETHRNDTGTWRTVTLT